MQALANIINCRSGVRLRVEIDKWRGAGVQAQLVTACSQADWLLVEPDDV